MSKKIGVIAEDNSDIDVVNNLLEKYIAASDFSIKKFIGNGCGKLRNKCDAWSSHLFDMGCEHVLIFHDLDNNNEKSLLRMIREKVPEKKYPNSIVVIPVEEIEAWLLSDPVAIKDVFNLKKTPRIIKNCDEIKSPKEHLESLVWAAGRKRYINSVHNKRLSASISLERLRSCASFRSFDKYVTEKIFV